MTSIVAPAFLRPAKAARNRAVVREHRAGVPTQEIAQKYGISTKRVQQIVFRAKHGTVMPLKYQEFV